MQQGGACDAFNRTETDALRLRDDLADFAGPEPAHPHLVLHHGVDGKQRADAGHVVVQDAEDVPVRVVADEIQVPTVPSDDIAVWRQLVRMQPKRGRSAGRPDQHTRALCVRP